MNAEETILWNRAKDLVVKVTETKGAKKRDSSIRMPTMDFESYKWSGKAADLPHFLQHIEKLLKPYNKQARYNYLHQCMMPKDHHLVAHTLDYDEAIKILSHLSINSSAEIENIAAHMLEMPVAQSEEEQLTVVRDLLVDLNKGQQLDPRWFVSLHAGQTILRSLFNPVDISNATNELTKKCAVLQAVIDAGDTGHIKRNGSASVVKPLTEILQQIRHESTNRSSVIQAKERALGHTRSRSINVQSQKTEVSGKQHELSAFHSQERSYAGPRYEAPVQGKVTTVGITIVCDLCSASGHGETRNCLKLEDFIGKSKDLPQHICKLHLGRKNAKCLTGGCDDYIDKKTGQSKNGLCTATTPAVNFRICGCKSCAPRASANLKRQKFIQATRKDAQMEKKVTKAPKLWPAPGVPRKGVYNPVKGGATPTKARQNKVEVRMVEVQVDQLQLDANMIYVNGTKLGKALCPAEVLSISGPSGPVEVLAMYDSHSQSTFIDPLLLPLCSSIRGTGNATVTIKTFSGASESLNRTIGRISIPVAGGGSIKVEGLMVEAKRRVSNRVATLPFKLRQMRDRGELAKEPQPGILYPTILFGADVFHLVFPDTVFEGDEAFSTSGFSLLKSKISNLYIPTGAFQNQEEMRTDGLNEVEAEVNQNLVNLEDPTQKVCSNLSPDIPAVMVVKSDHPDLDASGLAAIGSRINQDSCSDCGLESCGEECPKCVEVNQMITEATSPFHGLSSLVAVK